MGERLMYIVLFLLSILALIAVFIGLINPKIVIKWGKTEKRTRGKVLRLYGLSMILFFILFVVLTPQQEQEKLAPTEAEQKIDSKKVSDPNIKDTNKDEESKEMQEAITESVEVNAQTNNGGYNFLIGTWDVEYEDGLVRELEISNVENLTIEGEYIHNEDGVRKVTGTINGDVVNLKILANEKTLDKTVLNFIEEARGDIKNDLLNNHKDKLFSTLDFQINEEEDNLQGEYEGFEVYVNGLLEVDEIVKSGTRIGFTLIKKN
jgi:hypothetical protein